MDSPVSYRDADPKTGMILTATTTASVGGVLADASSTSLADTTTGNPHTTNITKVSFGLVGSFVIIDWFQSNHSPPSHTSPSDL